MWVCRDEIEDMKQDLNTESPTRQLHRSLILVTRRHSKSKQETGRIEWVAVWGDPTRQWLEDGLENVMIADRGLRTESVQAKGTGLER